VTAPAAEQLKRILTLIPHLADGEEHPIEEVAQLAGVDRQRLVADLTSVSERYDTPGGWVDGVSITVDPNNVSVRTSHFLRPMRLTMPELCALELGLGLLRQERSAEELPAIERATERLRKAITQLPSNEQHERLRVAELAAAGDPAHLATLRGALRAKKKVRLRYRAGSRKESSERVICPYSLVFASGGWFVIAYCDDSEGMRFFRVDRVETATQLDEGFTPDPGVDVASIAGDRPFAGTPARTMAVRYSPRIARWICEREGGTLADDGSLTREYPLGDTGWAVRHVLQYGPDAEVLAPVELREEIVRRLDSISV
jgi:predicted DNA-binding transcriptional regulator YafY